MSFPESNYHLFFRTAHIDKFNIHRGYEIVRSEVENPHFREIEENYASLLSGLFLDNFILEDEPRDFRVGLKEMRIVSLFDQDGQDTDDYVWSIRVHPETGRWRMMMEDFLIAAKPGPHAPTGEMVRASFSHAMSKTHHELREPLRRLLKIVWLQNHKLDPSLKLEPITMNLEKEKEDVKPLASPEEPRELTDEEKDCRDWHGYTITSEKSLVNKNGELLTLSHFVELEGHQEDAPLCGIAFLVNPYEPHILGQMRLIYR